MPWAALMHRAALPVVLSVAAAVIAGSGQPGLAPLRALTGQETRRSGCKWSLGRSQVKKLRDQTDSRAEERVRRNSKAV